MSTQIAADSGEKPDLQYNRQVCSIEGSQAANGLLAKLEPAKQG